MSTPTSTDGVRSDSDKATAPPVDEAVPSIWELAAAVRATVPDTEWHKLPTDLARHFDYYQRKRRRSVSDEPGD